MVAVCVVGRGADNRLKRMLPKKVSMLTSRSAVAWEACVGDLPAGSVCRAVSLPRG